MQRIPVPKGASVVLIRHAISDWNEATIKALEAGAQKPARLPGRRNAPLSALGHLESYFAAKYLVRKISPQNFSRKGVLAHSLHVRAKETSRIIVEHGGFDTSRVFQSDLLAERYHSRYAYVHETGREFLTEDSGISEIGQARKLGLGPVNYSQIVHTDMSDMRELIRHQPMLAKMLTTNDDMHLMIAYLLTSYRDSLEFFYRNALRNEGEVNPKRLVDLRQAAANKALSDFGSRIAPEFTDWFFEQEELKPNQRRKTPTGESFSDLGQRAREFFEDFMPMFHQAGENAIAIVVTHSFFIQAARQVVEGFSDDVLNKMINAEGPPLFPPHVGMTFYKEQDGVLVLDGEPNRIPPEFEVVGRRLRFKESTPQAIIDEACRALLIEEFRKGSNRKRKGNRKHSDHRFRFKVPDLQEERPAIIKAKPRKVNSEKKAS